MDLPKPLRVVSIVVVVLGIVRVIAGGLAFIGMRGVFHETPHLISQLIIDNFITGVLILVSGLLLLQGKEIGRIVLAITIIISQIACFIISQEYNIGTFIIFGAIMAVLFFEDSIKEYFLDKKQKQ